MANGKHKPPAGQKATANRRPVSFRKRVSATLSKFLQSHGLSLKEFARVVNVTERTARDWRSGRRPISFEKIAASSLWRAFMRCFIREERKAGAI